MNKNPFTNTAFVSVSALFCCALWGISTPVIKIGYRFVDTRSIPSLLLWAGLQFAIAGTLTVTVLSIVLGRFVLPQRKSLAGIAKIALFQTVLQYTFSYIGLLHTTAVKGTILKGSDAFISMLVASLLFKQEKLTPKKILACMIGFSGIVIVNLQGLDLNINPLGDGLVLLSIFVYSISAAITKQYAAYESPIVLSGYQMIIGGIAMILVGATLNGSFNFTGSLPIILCLSAIYALSYALWGILLKNNPVSKISMYSFMTPVFGVIFSCIMIQEESNISPVNLVIALLLICTGIILWNCKHIR